MKVLHHKSFVLIVVLLQTLVMVSYGFLSHQKNSPLIHHQSSAASLPTDQKFRHPLFQPESDARVLRRHRRSVANVQTMGLFGLGGPEIAIILAVGAFVIGPQQLGSILGSFAGNVKEEYKDLPDELKKIPEEFQKGFEESAENSKARNAKPMESVPDDENKKSPKE